MMATEAFTERPPTEKDTKEASEAMRARGGAMTPQGLPFAVRQEGAEVAVELSPYLGQLVLDMLGHVARGEMVTFLPYGAELSTKEAADLLNVSRPFLVNLLESGKIPFHRVGSHRRVRAVDILAYKKRRDRERSDALSDLQRLGQEFDAR